MITGVRVGVGIFMGEPDITCSYGVRISITIQTSMGSACSSILVFEKSAAKK